MKHLHSASWALCFLLNPARVGAAQNLPELKPIQDAVSAAEIEKTLRGLDYDRTSGSEGEQKAFAFMEQRLRECGVSYRRHDMRAFLSWPVEARVSIDEPGGASFEAITAAMGASTPPEGLAAEILILSAAGEADRRARGKIVIAPGMVSPESVLQAQEAGAAGVIHINETDTLHEMIATTIWGTPTTESARRIPVIPVASIGRSDGEQLRAAAAKGSTRVRMITRVERGWRSIPLIVAEVPGRTPDFIMVATHVDAWYRGMTDTAGTVASILEMARVLQQHRQGFERAVRFAWWSGHSFGRYPGSTWYADRFWADIDGHGVAYTNLDGQGRRGSRIDEVSAGGWPGIAEYSRAFAERLTGKNIAPSDRLFRPGRDSDSSFQGIGMPEFSIGVPGPPRGHPDVQPSGRIDYWHTSRDTLDKIDMNALALDIRYRVAQLYDLARLPVLPHRIAPIAASYIRALDQIAEAAGAAFDLSTTRALAGRLQKNAADLDQMQRPTPPTDIEILNSLLVKLTHRLNSTLYAGAGRFDQDPAAPVPILPLLARARELPRLDRNSDTFGFLETKLIRGRNAVEDTLRSASAEIENYLAHRN